MYCKNCGAFVDDRCYYCGNCKSPTEKEVHWNAYDKQNTYCFNPNSVNTFDVENDRLIEKCRKIFVSFNRFRNYDKRYCRNGFFYFKQ